MRSLARVRVSNAVITGSTIETVIHTRLIRILLQLLLLQVKRSRKLIALVVTREFKFTTIAIYLKCLFIDVRKSVILTTQKKKQKIQLIDLYHVITRTVKLC